MDSFEFNKIAGAVLAALLLAFGSGTLAEIIKGGGHGHDDHGKPGWVLPVSKAPAGAAAPEVAKFKPADVVALLKAASAENGQEVFKRCTNCHSADKGVNKPQGPSLYGVVGRDIASASGFTYSNAMKAMKGKWDFAQLASYLHNPRESVPGNRMAFLGVPDNAELADLLAFLRSKADTPVPLP